ncbi:mago binding domain-containing protein [Trichoderma breve]|uniref:Mago binding domain-containing protein n=1 Tax=Trichoderma breve TaxID=2034170 RepID=A0A9W9JQP4_9HYPO|nr:mago binding domain-containing protein [Trichoderma breve]KAJ4864238.1 mago binding domain-containing protein [Trichoderma breve]
MAPATTNSGITTDEASGERHIPESTRADGSKRKAIKIRPGYQPPEDVQVYKNRPAEAFRERGKRIGIPGAASAQDEKPDQGSAASNKNAKRREARKKAKAAGDGEGEGEAKADTTAATKDGPSKAEEADPEVEREKKARSLKKKLKQAKELKMKKDGGEGLLPEQIAKVIKINELIRELDALGFDAEGEPKTETKDDATEGSENKK